MKPVRQGYTALKANTGEIALELMEASEQPIDLLVTDVVMRHMVGPTLTMKIEARRPNNEVIYISGYAKDAFRSKVDAKVNFDDNALFRQQEVTVRSVILAVFHSGFGQFCSCFAHFSSHRQMAAKAGHVFTIPRSEQLALRFNDVCCSVRTKVLNHIFFRNQGICLLVKLAMIS
mgnify:CR=1 FL=1